MGLHATFLEENSATNTYVRAHLLKVMSFLVGLQCSFHSLPNNHVNLQESIYLGSNKLFTPVSLCVSQELVHWCIWLTSKEESVMGEPGVAVMQEHKVV